jgi:hypothetical protein
VARLDLLALFRALDRTDLAPQEIPQGCLRQLLEKDADYAEGLGALDQPEGSLDRRAQLGDTLTALDQLPLACFGNNYRAVPFPPSNNSKHPRRALNSKEAYSMAEIPKTCTLVVTVPSMTAVVGVDWLEFCISSFFRKVELGNVEWCIALTFPSRSWHRSSQMRVMEIALDPPDKINSFLLNCSVTSELLRLTIFARSGA